MASRREEPARRGSFVPWLIAAAVAYFVSSAGMLPDSVEAFIRGLG